jgi:hypothetical protein
MDDLVPDDPEFMRGFPEAGRQIEPFYLPQERAAPRRRTLLASRRRKYLAGLALDCSGQTDERSNWRLRRIVYDLPDSPAPMRRLITLIITGCPFRLRSHSLGSCLRSLLQDI